MHKSRFCNPHIASDKRTLRDAMLWKMGFYDDAPCTDVPPADFIYPIHLEPLDLSAPTAVWIGHSTYLIDFQGFRLLTDPIWSSHCSPIPIRALKRREPAAIALEALPRIDSVLISHNHYDHLDERTVRKLHRLQPHITWIIPKGLIAWFAKQRIHSCVELGWWDTFGGVTAVPTQHFSGRTLWDKDKTLWNGYVVQARGKTLYFVGDTGYNDLDFKKIGDTFPSIDLSLIPIGAYLPRRFMSPVHCNPEEGVKIHIDVKSRMSLGMHWNTFRLADEPDGRPPYDLYQAMKHHNLPFETFLPIDQGVYINW